MRQTAWIYPILPGAALPSGGAQEVGNKAWNLMRMVDAGLPVPPGFVLPTRWCGAARTGRMASRLNAALADGIAQIEAATGLGFGSDRRPLLVSVRSGAAISMPGMMETVLDIGLTDITVEGLTRLTGNPRLAWDSYRRLIQAFGEVVDGLDPALFEKLTADRLAAEGLETEHQLDYRALRGLAATMLATYRDRTGAPFPQSPAIQLARAVEAVFCSWDAPKAAEYRRINAIDPAIGTAVTVQTMVFGNTGGTSGAGVGFTRNPATGENQPYLDFQFNGQGEDVVAGRLRLGDIERLSKTLPVIWQELGKVRHRLESIFGDAQDFEFTVQEGRLYLLQTRRAKRTDWAAVRIAVDLVEDGLITPEQALALLDGIDLAHVSRERLKAAQAVPLAIAISASTGVVDGRIVFDSDAARDISKTRDPALLLRHETTTADIVGMNNAAGILTGSGGRTSHAAVVARQLNKVCLVGCEALSIDLERRTCRIGSEHFVEGDWLTLDGNSGNVYRGRIERETERPARELAVIAGWSAGALDRAAS